jgi:hypothetical protein
MLPLFAAPMLVALAVALLIRLETLASTELAAAPMEDVTLAACEASEEVKELMSEAREERRVVWDASALPAAEVRDWASETREERASDWADTRARGARRRMVVVENEKRIFAALEVWVGLVTGGEFEGLERFGGCLVLCSRCWRGRGMSR